MKPVAQSLRNEVICPNCKLGFRPDKDEAGRTYCKGCDPNNTGKIAPVKKSKGEIIYQDRQSVVDSQLEDIVGRLERLEKLAEQSTQETKVEEVSVDEKETD